MAPNVQKHVGNVYIFQLSFYFAYHRWWLDTAKLAEDSVEIITIIRLEMKKGGKRKKAQLFFVRF